MNNIIEYLKKVKHSQKVNIPNDINLTNIEKVIAKAYNEIPAEVLPKESTHIEMDSTLFETYTSFLKNEYPEYLENDVKVLGTEMSIIKSDISGINIVSHPFENLPTGSYYFN